MDALTYQVGQRTLVDTVTERGTLESQNTTSGRCELRGWQNKIIWIEKEGKIVKEGDVVVKLDTSEIDKEIDEAKIEINEDEGQLEQANQDLSVQRNKSESDIAAAELELELANLDLEKYREGDYKAEKSELERLIALAEAEAEKTRDEMNNIRALVKKGFRTPEQLREYELRYDSIRFQLERDRQKLFVLDRFEYPRKLTELTAKATEAARKLERAKTTAQAEVQKAESAVSNATNSLELRRKELVEMEKMREKCEIKAPQNGTIAYANQEWFSPEDRVREGATVRFQQDIFYLPDMTKMQVRVNIHESVVNKIQVGQRASIRLDAFPDNLFEGTVQYVSELAASSFSPTKNYDARVFVTEIPAGLQLKPGMTAEVEINVGRYEDVVAVPVGAATEHFGQSYAYVVDGGGVQRRRVTIGRSTHSHLEITDGLKIGDVVALDAYQRGLTDFADAEREVEKLQTPKPAAGAQAPGSVAAAAPPSDEPPAVAPAAAPSGETAPAETLESKSLEGESAPDTSTPEPAASTSGTAN